MPRQRIQDPPLREEEGMLKHRGNPNEGKDFGSAEHGETHGMSKNFEGVYDGRN